MSGKWQHRYERKPGRWVFNPTPEAREQGYRVKAIVEEHWTAPAFYFHLRSGGHVAALQAHLSNLYFFKLDISDFFGSISRTRLTRILKHYVSFVDARNLATWSTVLKPEVNVRSGTNSAKRATMLPYGFVQSVVLASMTLDMSHLGQCLRSVSATSGFVATVYVDDIIVSGNDQEMLQEVFEKVKEAGARSNFSFSSAKEESPSKAITAFNISLTNELLELSDAKMGELSSLFRSSISEHQKAGIKSYVQSVNTQKANSLG